MITNKGYKIPIDNPEVLQLKKELTVSPFIPGNKYPTKTLMYRVSDKYIYIPKYFGINKLGKPKDVKEQNGLKVPFKFNGKLRDYQQPVCEKVLTELLRNDSCLASLYTGWGKTPGAIWLISQLGLKTLIVVHKETLLEQWTNQILFFLGKKPSIIQGKKIDTSGDIVIGMIQSLSMKEYPPETFKDFGLCIYDEVHHTPSKVFSSVFYKVGTKHNLGLSATIKRADGLASVMNWFLGETIVNIKQVTQCPQIDFYEYIPDKIPEEKLMINRKINIPAMVTDLCNNSIRTNYIIDKIRKYYTLGRNILILSDRRGHCEEINFKLKDLPVGLYLGGMPNDALTETNSKRIIVATYSMASEGYDNPKLDTLILASPKSNIEQSVGRILRQKNKNNPIVVDIVDRYSIFLAFSNVRKRFYLQKKFIKKEQESKVEKYSFRD
jgi:superfamily II DNA or RNA helicase